MNTGCYCHRLLWLQVTGYRLPFMSPAVTSFSSLTRGAKYDSTLAALPPALSICTLHGNRCTSPQLVRGCLNLIGCFSDDIITWSRGEVDITNKGLTSIESICVLYVVWAIASFPQLQFLKACSMQKQR